MSNKRYRCGECGIASPADRWIFDWEDPVESVIWLVCPHCSVRSARQLLESEAVIEEDH